MTAYDSGGSGDSMPRKVTRSEWRAIALDMAIESSEMEVLVHGKQQKRPIVRVLFRTERGKVFSGPRISEALRTELEGLTANGPWLPPRRGRRQ